MNEFWKFPPGIVPVWLKNKKIGKLCQSRWLTLASRLCRLYISGTCTDPNLPLLVNYVVQVYYKVIRKFISVLIVI